MTQSLVQYSIIQCFDARGTHRHPDGRIPTRAEMDEDREPRVFLSCTIYGVPWSYLNSPESRGVQILDAESFIKNTKSLRVCTYLGN